MKFPWRLASAVLACGLASPSFAQDESAFVKAFAGKWDTLSHNYSRSTGEPCSIELLADLREKSGETNTRATRIVNCGAELAGVTDWSIQSGQIALLDSGKQVVALLGGSQRRLNGRTGTRNAVTLLRRDGPFAQTTMDCVYLGYTASCAARLEQAAPRVMPGTSVNVLTRTNMRQTPSTKASALAIVPPNTCLPVNECLAGSDGIWCKARYRAMDGWIKKETKRLDRYPVVTFANGC